MVCRGIEGKEIFKDKADYKEFLNRLSKLAVPEGIKVYAFALMPNHIHLLIRPLKISLSAFMRRLLTGYAMYFNQKYKRTGHLFQNRYKSYVVEEDGYLLELIRYIHLNPVRAGIIQDLDKLAIYPNTGHSTLMGRINHSFMDATKVLFHFSDQSMTARRRLVEFMQDGLAIGPRSDLAGGGLKRSLARLDPGQKKERQAYDERILGNGLFVETILKELDRKQDDGQKRVSLENLLAQVACQYNLTMPELCSGSRRLPIPEARTVVVYVATKQFGTKPRELSEILNVGVTTIYEQVRMDKGRIESKSITLD